MTVGLVSTVVPLSTGAAAPSDGAGFDQYLADIDRGRQTLPWIPHTPAQAINFTIWLAYRRMVTTVDACEGFE